MKQLLAVLLLTAAARVTSATPIDAKYQQLGGAGGFLGKATVDETTAPDGVGKFRHYEKGSIYWHPETGAREVHGLIRNRWAQLGWEKSYLGYPITDEIPLADGSGNVSKFKGGELIWRSATNLVSTVKSSDLIVDLPFPSGEPWIIGQTNAVVDSDSHQGPFAYCIDLNPAQGVTAGRPIVATATARIAYMEQGLASGKANPGNVVIQRYAEGRYASYLHLANGSYSKEFEKGPGLHFSPQSLGWDARPVPTTGSVIADVGDTGTGAGNHHLHYCVTTTPDRPAFKPFESVPVAFRNYSVSTNGGASWTYVASGVPHSGQWVRREKAKPAQPGEAEVNAAVPMISYGSVKGQVLAGDGKATGAGTLTIQLVSAWGEPLKKKTVSVPANNLSGPWPFEFAGVPAFTGLKLSAKYDGPWNHAADSVDAEGTAFDLAPNGTAAAPALTLKTTLVK